MPARALRLCWPLALFCILATSAVAQTPRIERVDVVEAAIYRTREEGGVLHAELVQAATLIPARLGTAFGFKYVVVGPPAGTQVPLRLVTHYPDPGIRDPASRDPARRRSEEVVFVRAGESLVYGFRFGQAWEAVPGPWLFELWDGNRKLAEQAFTVVAEPR
jgi:hypothetical protein